MSGPLRDRRGKGPSKKPPSGGPGRQLPPGKSMGFWLIIAVLFLFGFQLIKMDRSTYQVLSYSTFINQMETGNLAEFTQNGRQITGKLIQRTNLPVKGGSLQDVVAFETTLPTEDPELINKIREANGEVEINGIVEGINWMGALLGYLPFILLIGIWLFFLRQMQGGGNKAFSFGKSKAKLVNADRPSVTFADVAGCDEAKVDLEEIIEFLRSPKKFTRLGGRIPKGALLVGAPGTGKTLLAKAVAGEASVPFFAMSGSDFVEMFVGVGASRVRDLFENGKKHAPCILFIDEIDAVGRHRGAGMGGGHDEREQTLNQLLVEMDGFETNEGVILIAATNRVDVLDPALLRPGRFDRRITVDMPDILGREGILKVHMRKINSGPDIDIKKIARGTPGMSGADLANLVNEGALLAARRNHEQVTQLDLEDAKERVMIGPEKKARVMSDKERKITAYHECGHAIVAASLEDFDPVHKVTIIPRGGAGGLTWILPKEDRSYHSAEYLEQQIAMAMGGRAAEEIIFGEFSSGASSDIRSATSTARHMVNSLGMSERLGPISFGGGEQPVFMGRDFAQGRGYSEQTAIAIDEEVHRIINGNYEKAKGILNDKIDELHKMAEVLLERETLDGEDVVLILNGEDLPLPEVESETEEQEANPEITSETQDSEEEGPEAGPIGGQVPPPQPS